MARFRARTDWLLAATALGLVGLWFALEPRSILSNETAGLPFAALESRPPQTLNVTSKTASITVTHTEAPNAEHRFVIQGSRPLPADEAAVDRLIFGLTALEILRDVPEPRHLTQLGLLAPELRITFTLEKATVSVSLGNQSQAPDNGRYALISTNGKQRVVVLTPTTATALDVPPEQLVEHRLVDWLPSEVRQVTLTRDFNRIAIVQLENGHFELGSEPRRRAKRVNTEALLLALTGLTVERYLDDKSAPNTVQGSNLDDKSAPESAQSANLDVVLESNSERHPTPETLHFGGACPGDPATVTVSLTGTVTRTGCVNRKVLEVFPNTELELVDNRLFFLHADEAEKLSVESLGNRFVLERRGTAFRLIEPESQEISLDAGNALFGNLVATQGTLLGPCESRLLNPPLKVTLRSGIVGQKSFYDETLRVGPLLPSGERRVCRDDDQMLLVNRDLASSLTIDRNLLRNPQRLNVPYDSIFEVSVSLPQGVERLKRDDHGHLVLIEPKLPGDTASIESLTERLAQLTAERWLTPSTLNALRHERPSAIVTFWVNQENGERVARQLRLFRGIERYAIAHLDNDEAPFVLADTTAELLDGLLVDRSIYRLTEQDRVFSLSRNNQQIRCEKSARGFSCPSQRLTETAITQLTETLSHLRAVRVDAGNHVPYAKATETLTPLHAARRDAGNHVPFADALVLRVYGPEPKTEKPRFTLNLRPAKDAEHWTAPLEDPKFVASYRAADLELLLRLFENPNPLN